MVAFQKDYYSRADCVKFTVNLTVSDKRIWAIHRDRYDWYPVRPSGNSTYMPGSAQIIRLGNLMPPDGQDRWWEVGPRRPSGPAARRILKAIEGTRRPVAENWRRAMAGNDSTLTGSSALTRGILRLWQH